MDKEEKKIEYYKSQISYNIFRIAQVRLRYFSYSVVFFGFVFLPIKVLNNLKQVQWLFIILLGFIIWKSIFEMFEYKKIMEQDRKHLLELLK